MGGAHLFEFAADFFHLALVFALVARTVFLGVDVAVDHHALVAVVGGLVVFHAHGLAHAYAFVVLFG